MPERHTRRAERGDRLGDGMSATVTRVVDRTR